MKRTLALTALILGSWAAVLPGQTYHAGLRGVVQDSSGGVLPGTTVAIISESTGFSRISVANELGQYAFPDVQPAVYTVRAELDGFGSFEQTGVELSVQRFLVLDIRLELASVRETITVTSESPVLENATASQSSSLEHAELEILPTPSRNPFYVSTTTPNVIPTGQTQWTRMQDQNQSSLLSIAGGPRRGNNYTLDGVSITDINNRAVIIPSMEAVEEVKVQASTYDAEMGRTGGGVFNTIHRTGSNAWHGSAMVQNRPDWAVGQLYFAKQAGEPKEQGYYWLYAGSFGGPIIRDKTFFWAATEGYRTSVTRNTLLTLPTAGEARGDFSHSGVTVYDPLTTRPDPNHPGQYVRDPFPGNVIPPDRLDPVGSSLAAYLSARGEGDLSASANVVDAADQFSLNLDHHFSDRAQLTGTYMFYHSHEPFPEFYGGPVDPNVDNLFRKVHVLALNQTVIPSSDRVLTFRYGYLSFQDDDHYPAFDPAGLGFSQRYLGQVTADVFPAFNLDGYGFFGSFATNYTTYYSHSANGTVSQIIGDHSLKLGGDYRRIGQDGLVGGERAGLFGFDAGFTQGPDPLDPSGSSGSSLASLLLGYPASGSLFDGVRVDQFIDYFAGFVQDDWRVTPNLVLNLGLRLEHENGPKEKNNQQIVGFDRTTPWPVQPIDGMTLAGGLMYAGVDGYPVQQGDPQALKWGPRAGFAWSLDPETVLRGGYGVFWAPYQPTYEYNRGYQTSTNYFPSADGGLTPAGKLSDPFPFGVQPLLGSSLGLLTGAGSDVEFPDQFRKAAYVQQYSLEIQRELTATTTVAAGYLASRSSGLGIGGPNYVAVNINQLDPRYQSLGSALLDPVPNPFFGNPVFGDLSQSETVPRNQLLRPYPQFGAVYALQPSAGKRRYQSVVLKLDKRFRSGIGTRVNYTWSRTKDNVIGEGNVFSRWAGGALNSYDLNAEYGTSITDAPHRLNVSGIAELPFGKGKRWLDRPGVWNALFGGWSASVAGFLQSGFPISVSQRLNNTGLLGDLQRPNVVLDVDPGPSGTTVENLNGYLDPNAWSLASAFTFGDAPRTDTRVRTPARNNWDFAFQKSESVGTGRITARVEIINAFDHPDFSGPVTVLGNPNFGRILDVSGFPRLFQFTVRYDW
jgi:trimeric autotransporter adhesin